MLSTQVFQRFLICYIQCWYCIVCMRLNSLVDFYVPVSMVESTCSSLYICSTWWLFLLYIFGDSSVFVELQLLYFRIKNSVYADWWTHKLIHMWHYGYYNYTNQNITAKIMEKTFKRVMYEMLIRNVITR